MRLPLALTLLCLSAAPAAAQGLGAVEFPTSGAPTAQVPFIRGLLLLHSFEYEDAARAFREAEAADPGFALAYWGEAMTYTHPLWNEQDSTAARAALLRLGATAAERMAKAPTARERGYLETTEALYFSGASKPKRDTLTARAFERLMTANPDDQDAKAFYALWLMGLSQGVRNIPAYMRAGALAEDVYLRNPRHPGALHYIIHAFDDPVHAPLGLRAAREYSVIVPDADHAQHMTTHIFLALGMWPETVRQNAIASGADSTLWRPGHYTAWMNYALLQEGRYADARRQLDVMRANMDKAPTPSRRSALLFMRAHYLATTGAWSDPIADWVVDTGRTGSNARAIAAYTTGLVQLGRGRMALAEAAAEAARRLDGTALAEYIRGQSAALPKILATQLRARILWARNQHSAAIALLQDAGTLEDTLPAEFGPPDVVKPTHELLGEYLLSAKRPADAQREFQHALQLAPGRSAALYGLARASLAIGDSTEAARALAQLGTNWHDADATIPEVAELRRMQASRQAATPGSSY
jgi:tetratricopeptide (TPR) repeat protein